MKKLLLILSLMSSMGLCAMDAEEILDIVVQDGRMLLDTARYEKILPLIHPTLKDSLEKQRRAQERLELLGVSRDGLGEIIRSLDSLENSDPEALRALNLQYLAANNYVELCALISASHYLGIEAVLTSVQELLKNDYKALMAKADSTFFMSLLTLLLRLFPQVCSLNQIEGGYTLLGYAAAQGKNELVTFLLAQGAAVDQTDHEGVTPLIHASKNGHLDSVNLLLAQKASVNRCDQSGRSALMEAARCGRLDVVKQLVGYGAEVSLADKQGMTALEHAVMNQNDEVVKELGGTDAAKDLPLFKRKIRAQVLLRKQQQKPADWSKIPPENLTNTPPGPNTPRASNTPAQPIKTDPGESTKKESSFSLLYGIYVGVACFIVYKLYLHSGSTEFSGARKNALLKFVPRYES